MRCSNPNCGCPTHVDPATHIPCCPFHAIPLIQYGDLGDLAACPKGRDCPTRGGHIDHERWYWAPRDNFHGHDLPPANGWLPIEIPEELL